MSAEMAVEVFRVMLTTCLVMVAPMLATAMAVGLVVSLLQAVTSIQEQTLAFVPKLVAVAGVLMFSAYWLIEQIVGYTQDIFNRISNILG
jgi:flagellar biosynthetic protein FliQ